MNLYHWKYSEALKNYARGDIIVMGETEEEARSQARLFFMDWLKKDREYLFMTWQDDDDREEIAKLVELLEKT